MKNALFYILIFLGSFILTFLALYLIMIGPKNPLELNQQAADSTMVAGDSTSLSVSGDEDVLANENLVDIESAKQQLNERVDDILRDRLYDKEQKIDILLKEIAELKYTNDMIKKKIDFVASPLRIDTLNQLKDALTKVNKEITDKESLVKKLNTDIQTIKTSVEDSLSKNSIIDSLESVIETEKKQKEKQIQEIETLQDQLKQMEKQNVKEELRSKNIKQLAKVYEAMRPEDAAKIMVDLNDTLVVSLLKKIKQRQAGKIMSSLPSIRAANISRMLTEPVESSE